MKKSSVLVAAVLFFCGCAGYDKTYQSYSQSVAQINAANAQAAAAYYNLKAIEIQQQTALKVAAIQTSAKGQGSVIFIGSDSVSAVPVFNASMPSAPDPAPGARYAVEFGKAVVYGASAAILGHQVFSTIEDISGTVSNVTSTVTNANQANQTENKTVTVSDSGNSTTDSSNSGNSTDQSETVTVSDSGNTTDSRAVSVQDSGNTTDSSTTVSDSGNTTDNSITQTMPVTVSNSGNSAENSNNTDSSDHSDSSDSSVHDNDNSTSTTENILPGEEPTGEVQ